jgi:hypothetical protein
MIHRSVRRPSATRRSADVTAHQSPSALVQFRERRSRGRKSAHDRPDRDGENRRRFSVSVPLAVDEQYRFALSFRQW